MSESRVYQDQREPPRPSSLRVLVRQPSKQSLMSLTDSRIQSIRRVLADYSYESIEFWEPDDEPYKRLLTVAKGASNLQRLLQIACRRVNVEAQCDEDVNHLIEKLCVAYWEANK